MRSASGTNFGLAWSVVVRTNSFIADFAAPSFHEGSGSDCASACVLSARPAPAVSMKAHREHSFVLMAASLNLSQTVEAISQFLTQGAFDQVELDFRSGRGSQECNHLAPRFEDAVEPANEGHHNPDFGFSVEYHDPEANSSTKTAVDCRALIKNFSPNFSLKTVSRAR